MVEMYEVAGDGEPGRRDKQPAYARAVMVIARYPQLKFILDDEPPTREHLQHPAQTSEVRRRSRAAPGNRLVRRHVGERKPVPQVRRVAGQEEGTGKRPQPRAVPVRIKLYGEPQRGLGQGRQVEAPEHHNRGPAILPLRGLAAGSRAEPPRGRIGAGACQPLPQYRGQDFLCRLQLSTSRVSSRTGGRPCRVSSAEVSRYGSM